jgi:hypothetical protein
VLRVALRSSRISCAFLPISLQLIVTVIFHPVRHDQYSHEEYQDD